MSVTIEDFRSSLLTCRLHLTSGKIIEINLFPLTTAYGLDIPYLGVNCNIKFRSLQHSGEIKWGVNGKRSSI